MRTILECNLFLREWEGVLSENDLSQIRMFMNGVSLSPDSSPSFPRLNNLHPSFVRWFNSDYDVSRFDRILYSVGDRKWVGIVKNVNRRTGEILLYTSFSYSDSILYMKAPKCSLGFDMRPATESEYKRLRRELNGVGLIWKDKLHRLEPSVVKADTGGTYFYINDQLQIVSAREEKGKTSHLRYIAGNYFTDYGKALEVCDKIRELLKSSLVKNGELD